MQIRSQLVSFGLTLAASSVLAGCWLFPSPHQVGEMVKPASPSDVSAGSSPAPKTLAQSSIQPTLVASPPPSPSATPTPLASAPTQKITDQPRRVTTNSTNPVPDRKKATKSLGRRAVSNTRQPRSPSTPSSPTTTSRRSNPPSPQASPLAQGAAFSPQVCHAGMLVPSRSGSGINGPRVYASGIIFPIAMSFRPMIGTAVYAAGGQFANPQGGNRCDALQLRLPWRDNFCELRSGKPRRPGLCPGTSQGGHQGNDIRVGDAAVCRTMSHQKIAEHRSVPILAVADGKIRIGDYAVYLRSERREPNGAISLLEFRYLHMFRANLLVPNGASVKQGQVLGYMSRYFGHGTSEYATIEHLHFEIRGSGQDGALSALPPYASLVAALKGPVSQVSDATCRRLLQ
jgi:murein DD-endopeptidase MepM/ murein hydrolase activator NlpD